MAKLKRANAYRRLERPYTRWSKYKKEAFVRTAPNLKVVRFDMGNLTKEFEYQVNLLVKEPACPITKQGFFSNTPKCLCQAN